MPRFSGLDYELLPARCRSSGLAFVTPDVDAAWIGIVGVIIGAVIGTAASLGGQYMNGRTTERVAHRIRQHIVLDDLSGKLMAVRAQALSVQQSPGEDDGLVVALRSLQTISPSIHDDELLKRVNAFVDATYGFRPNPVNWKAVQEPYDAVRERLTQVYRELG